MNKNLESKQSVVIDTEKILRSAEKIREQIKVMQPDELTKLKEFVKVYGWEEANNSTIKELN